MTRDTSTGISYERFISNILNENGIVHQRQVNVGNKRNGKGHRVDLIIDNCLVSLKYQGVGGTAEEKVPFEFMKLQDAIEDYGYSSGLIVIDGEGWTWKEEYLSERFLKRMQQIAPNVTIVDHNQFMEMYNLYA